MKRLEAIVHPLVRAREAAFLEQARRDGAPIAVLDIPLLYETGAEGRVDAVVVVSAPESVQRERVLARPGMTEEKFAAILSRQVPDSEKRRRADHIIDTSRGLDAAREQVAALLKQLARGLGRECARSCSIPKPPASIRCAAIGWWRSAASRC